MKTVYDFTVKDRKGNDVSLKEYANEVLLIVNTATKCGFTPQYEELEKLYKEKHADGFEILDFPCNQFGQQAPGTDEPSTSSASSPMAPSSPVSRRSR
jgi:glutathione peroxidase